MHARSNFDRAIDGRPGDAQRHEAMVARVGDGSQFTAADFGKLSIPELMQLREVNPEVYAAISDGRDPGQSWRPTSQEVGR